jgi:hypothetical protein
MIKQQVHRLIELFALYRANARMTEVELFTYGMLSADFEQWDPDAIERERDEARRVAREIANAVADLAEASGYIEGLRDDYHWLKADK